MVTMHRLPALSAGECQWRLPLSATSAAQLCSAVLTDDLSRRQWLLERVLRDDPALAVWTTCRMDPNQPQSTTELAAWLSSRSLDVLQWSESDTEFTATAEQPTAAWIELFRRSLFVARRAARLASHQRESEHLYLLGLVHLADQWLENSYSLGAALPSSASQPELTCLPPWLRDRLHRTKADRAQKTPQSLLATVIRQAAEPLPIREDPDDTCYVDQAVLHWNSADDAGSSLPRLTAKLLQLRQLQTQYARQLEREKLAAMKELAYGAGHEINNPLANIATRAQTLLLDEKDPERRRKLATINTQAFRAYEMISDLMLFAHPPAQKTEQVDLVPVLHELAEQFGQQAEDQGTQLRTVENESNLLVDADRTQLELALSAMIRNSLEALQEGGEIELSLARIDDTTDHQLSAQICIRDTGPGIDAQTRRHLFDPFFSGREAGRGLGFGLSKAWRIVELHGGEIEVHSEPQCGATFEIRLPISVPPADEAPVRCA